MNADVTLRTRMGQLVATLDETNQKIGLFLLDPAFAPQKTNDDYLALVRHREHLEKRISTLKALLVPDPEGQALHPDTVALIMDAIDFEEGRFRCVKCGKNSLEGADEEGDGGWWCLICMNKWEAVSGCHWEDGTPIKS